MKYIVIISVLLLLCSCEKYKPNKNVNVIELGDIENVIDENSLGIYDPISYLDPEEVIDPNDDDFVENHNFSSSITITYTSNSASCSDYPEGISVSIEEADVVINSTLDCIEYILKGSSTNGSFKIYSTNKFKLTLDGIDLTSSKGAAINSQSSKRMFVVLNQNTSNSLKDATSYSTPDSEDEKGCIFSEGQIIFSGKGSLSIISVGKHCVCTFQK